MTRTERLLDRAFAIVYWPWRAARGRSVVVRLTAVTVGWVWVVTMVFLVMVPVVVFVLLPTLMWEAVSE